MTRIVRRIVLEPADDGKTFRVVVEPGDDVSGHGEAQAGQLVLETVRWPNDAPDQQRYKVTIDGEDVEGLGFAGASDRSVKRDIVPVTW